MDDFIYTATENPKQRQGYLNPKQRQGFLPKASTPERLRSTSAPWNEADIPKRDWIAPRFVCRGTVTVLAGPGAASKSLLGIGWAVAIALGCDLGDFRPAGAHRVMVLNYEDDDHEQQRRLSAALRWHGRTPTDLENRLTRIVCPDAMGALFRPDLDGAIETTSFFDDLDAELAAFPYGVLFLDVFTEIHDFNESSNPEVKSVMRRLVALARKHNIAIVVIHHFRKGASEPGDVDAIRGASAIVNTARQAFTLAPMSQEEALAWGISPDSRKFFSRLDDAKLNYHAGGATAWFERTYYPLDNGESIPASLPWTPPSDQASLMQIEALVDGIAAGTDEGPYARTYRKNTPRSIQALFQDLGLANKAANAALLTSLITEGRIEEATWRHSSRRHHTKALRVKESRLPMADWKDDEGLE